jgi:hypothetical protein
MNQAVTLARADLDRAGVGDVVALTTFPATGLADELAVALSPDHAGQVMLTESGNLLDELPSVPDAAGLIWCWARLEELWQDLPPPMTDPPRDYVDAALELADAVLELSRLRDRPLLYVLPAIPADRPLGVGDANTTSGVVATATAVREALRARLAGHRGVYLVDVEEDIRLLGLAGATAGPGPYSTQLYRGLARRTAALTALLRASRVRVAVVAADTDLDTQRRLLQWRRAGVALVACGDEMPDGPLRPHHFAAVRPGPCTSDAIGELARELGVRPDEVAAVPGPGTLSDRLPPDATDRLRLRGDWRAARQRSADLGVEVRFRSVTGETAPDELLSAGHAFELNEWSAGRAELAVLAASTDHLVRLVALRDLDGDHGVVGLFVVRLTDPEAELVAFRLSGVAAGKGVERAALAEVTALSGGRGVVAVPRELGTNEPAVRFFGGLGAPGPLPAVTWPEWIRRERSDD